MAKSIQFKLVIIILVLAFIPLTVVFASSYLTEKTILLTFDDGPHPQYTPEVLSILEKNDIKAIFFVVGREVEKYPNLLRQIDYDGHVIANHTYSHSIITGLNKEELVNEVQKTDVIIKDVIGKDVTYFRPPTGAYNKEEAEIIDSLGKTVLMWDYGLEKQALTNAEELVTHLLTRIDGKNEVTLLLHDGDPSNKYSRDLTVEALPFLIDELKKMGYTFIDPNSQKGNEYMGVFSETNKRIGVFK